MENRFDRCANLHFIRDFHASLGLGPLVGINCFYSQWEVHVDFIHEHIHFQPHVNHRSPDQARAVAKEETIELTERQFLGILEYMKLTVLEKNNEILSLKAEKDNIEREFQRLAQVEVNKLSDEKVRLAADSKAGKKKNSLFHKLMSPKPKGGASEDGDTYSRSNTGSPVNISDLNFDQKLLNQLSSEADLETLLGVGIFDNEEVTQMPKNKPHQRTQLIHYTRTMLLLHPEEAHKEQKQRIDCPQ
jgi:hypothetical protein